MYSKALLADKQHNPAMNDSPASMVIERTRSWLVRAVIDLNLCPFAKAVHAKSQIRYAVSQARSTEQLQQDLVQELEHLQRIDPAETDTTLLIHPFVLLDFYDYNNFLDVAESCLNDLGLSGEMQIASFHPHYQFAGTAPDDVTNSTNRAPYPTLHLLRASSVDRAVAAYPEAKDIYERNIMTMRRLGQRGWAALMQEYDGPAD